MIRHFGTIHIAPKLNFRRDIPRNVLRPMLEGIKGNNPDWVIKLTRQKVADDRFEVRPLDFALSVDSAVCAEAVHDDVDRLISAIGDDIRCPNCCGHTPAPTTASQIPRGLFVPLVIWIRCLFFKSFWLMRRIEEHFATEAPTVCGESWLVAARGKIAMLFGLARRTPARKPSSHDQAYWQPSLVPQKHERGRLGGGRICSMIHVESAG